MASVTWVGLPLMSKSKVKLALVSSATTTSRMSMVRPAARVPSILKISPVAGSDPSSTATISSM